MKLKFYARSGHIVPVPGTRRTFGQFRQYIGRETIAGTDTVPAQLLTTEAGTEFDSDALSAEGVNQIRLAIVRDKGLWCANKETAAFMGCVFVPVRFKPETTAWEAIVAPVAAEADKPSKKAQAS